MRGLRLLFLLVLRCSWQHSYLQCPARTYPILSWKAIYHYHHHHHCLDYYCYYYYCYHYYYHYHYGLRGRLSPARKPARVMVADVLESILALLPYKQCEKIMSPQQCRKLTTSQPHLPLQDSGFSSLGSAVVVSRHTTAWPRGLSRCIQCKSPICRHEEFTEEGCCKIRIT